MESTLLKFSGKVKQFNLNTDRPEVEEHKILARLRKKSNSIGSEIKSDITRELSVDCDVMISFRNGCIQWEVIVEIFSNLSTGIISSTKIIKGIVDSKIIKGFKKSTNNRKLSERINPTFDIDSSVEIITTTEKISKSSSQRKEIIKEAKQDVSPVASSIPIGFIYIILVLSIVSSIVGFVALALALTK